MDQKLNSPEEGKWDWEACCSIGRLNSDPAALELTQTKWRYTTECLMEIRHNLNDFAQQLRDDGGTSRLRACIAADVEDVVAELDRTLANGQLVEDKVGYCHTALAQAIPSITEPSMFRGEFEERYALYRQTGRAPHFPSGYFMQIPETGQQAGDELELASMGTPGFFFSAAPNPSSGINWDSPNDPFGSQASQSPSDPLGHWVQGKFFAREALKKVDEDYLKRGAWADTKLEMLEEHPFQDTDAADEADKAAQDGAEAAMAEHSAPYTPPAPESVGDLTAGNVSADGGGKDGGGGGDPVGDGGPSYLPNPQEHPGTGDGNPDNGNPNGYDNPGLAGDGPLGPAFSSDGGSAAPKGISLSGGAGGGTNVNGVGPGVMPYGAGAGMLPKGLNTAAGAGAAARLAELEWSRILGLDSAPPGIIDSPPSPGTDDDTHFA